MEHVCTAVLFSFWDGKTQYTVEYSPSLKKWFVFDGEARENALAQYALERGHRYHINHMNAKYYLEKYLETPTP